MDVLLLILGFGFLMGLKHSFEADHVAAVSTIASKSKSIAKSMLVGASWGIGHSLALLFAGLLIIVLKLNIPDYISNILEFIAGLVLIVLGVNFFLKIRREKIHIHEHQHGKEKHIHFHSHKISKNHMHGHENAFRKSALIGIVHGLAGSAPLALLSLTETNSLLIGLVYILLFCIGSIAGMVIAGAMIYLPFSLIPKSLGKIGSLLKAVAASLSVFIGLGIVYNVALV